MTSQDRTRVRMKQDFLRMLAVDMCGFDESLAVTEGGPRLSQLTGAIFPDWEHAVDCQIVYLANEKHVGVPDFNSMAARA